ncbi:MAG: hypothetical protein WC297_00710 [Candidatus Paceibacterota bacterium]|jgi:hypothetical protein
MEFNKLVERYHTVFAVLIKKSLTKEEWGNLIFKDCLAVVLECERCQEHTIESLARTRMQEIGTFQDWKNVREKGFNVLGDLHHRAFDMMRSLAKTINEWKMVYDAAEDDEGRAKALAKIRELCEKDEDLK